MDINEHQDQKHTWGDNDGRDLYLLGVNVLVSCWRVTASGPVFTVSHTTDSGLV